MGNPFGVAPRITSMSPRRLLVPAVFAFAALGLTGCAGGLAGGAAADAAGLAASVDPTAPVVAFYGDSYTLGTGASDPAKRWSTVISAERRWTEVNPSTNGLGFVNNRAQKQPDELDEIIDAQPDIVFVTMGLNDNFSMPDRAGDIEAAIDRDFDRLDTELPNARLIVVEPFWYTDERPSSVAEIIGWVHAAATRSGADYIPDASYWLEGHPEWMASDGLHPNDDGYAVMAKRMDEALTEIGL